MIEQLEKVREQMEHQSQSRHKLRRILMLWAIFTSLLIYAWYVKDDQNEKLVNQIRAMQEAQRHVQPVGRHHGVQHTIKLKR